MKKNLLFLLVFSLLLITNSQAVEVESYEYNNENLLLPIPNGFCNATDELIGIIMLDFLNMQISNIIDDSLRAEVAIVFTRCGFENNIDEMYPWGYIGLINNTKPQLTQQTFNESLDMVLDSSKMMQKLEEIVGNAKKDAVSEFGLDLGSFGINQPMLGWTDKNIAIVTTTAQYALEGELFTEIVVQGSSVANKVLVNYYITDEENGISTPLENATLLIDNSKLLVRLNK